jgi:hypothetical protein
MVRYPNRSERLEMQRKNTLGAAKIAPALQEDPRLHVSQYVPTQKPMTCHFIYYYSMWTASGFGYADDLRNQALFQESLLSPPVCTFH